MPSLFLRRLGSASLLGACLTLTACDGLPLLRGERPPPFELFGRSDMRPGVSIETLRAAAAKESKRYRWRCRPLWVRAQSCALTVQPGELRAIVDSTGRVIRMTVIAPDSFFVWEETPPNEPKYRYYVNRLRETWDAVRPHRFGPTEHSVAEYRWVDPNGRWSAQMWYSPWSRYKTRSYKLLEEYRDSLARVPDSLAVTDEPEYSKFVALRPPPPVPVAVVPELEPRPAPPPPTPEVVQQSLPSEFSSLSTALPARLLNLAESQRYYYSKHGRFASTLDALGWPSDDDIVLRLVGVTSKGWAAVAIYRGLPSRSCVYYEGSVSPPLTLAERREGLERSVVCDLF